MGMPISFDLSEDEVRTKLCTAPDCRCPDCHQRRLIRLGSLTAHQHRYSRSGQMGGIHAGYIFTDLPDYRFRHALNAETTPVQAVSRDDSRPQDSQRDHRGDSNTGTGTGSEAQTTTTVFDRETLLTNASSSSTAAAALPQTSSLSSATGAVEPTTAAGVVDQEQQERCDDEEGGTAYGRDRNQRVRAQAWATNVEGLDYYHESDQDS